MLTHLILPRLHRLRPYSCGLLLTLLLTACVNDGGGSETAPASTKITATVRHTDGSVSSASSASVGDLVELQAPPLQGDNVTYQWYRNGATISGATSASFYLGQISSVDDKAVFTVQVATAEGKKTSSDPLSLTVSAGNNVDLLAGWLGGSGNADGLGAAARFTNPQGITHDNTGNLYVADANMVRKISPDGMVTTLAGKAGAQGQHVDGPASAASFVNLNYITIDGAGNLYVTDDGIIRKITADGTASTLANADGTIRFAEINGLCSDPAGNLYAAGSNSVRKISPTGAVSTLAGVAGQPGNSDGAGAAARFNYPQGIACATNGAVYVADTGNAVIRKIAPDSTVTTLGNMPPEVAVAVGQTVPQTGPHIASRPIHLAIDTANNLLITDSSTSAVYRVTPAGELSRPVAVEGTASNDRIPLFSGHSFAGGITVDSAGNAYVTDNRNYSIRKLNPSGAVSTLAGRGISDTYNGYDVGTVSNTAVSTAITSDASGNVYVVGAYHLIRKIMPDGRVTQLIDPTNETIGLFDSVAADKAGNLYLADASSHTIRKITPAGMASIVAGSRNESGSTDGPAGLARFTNPTGIAIDGAGNLYVAEECSNVVPQPTPEVCGRIRKITPGGAVSTRTNIPGILSRTLVSDADGNLYAAGANTLYKLAIDGTLVKLAGSNGSAGLPVLPGNLSVRSLAVDPSGNVYAAGADTIVKITPAGQVTTLAGRAGNDGAQLGPLPGGLNTTLSIAFGYRNSRPMLFAFNMRTVSGAFLGHYLQSETNVLAIPLQ